MEDKYKIFINFDFENNDAWKKYLSSFDLQPNNNQLLRLKKVFYKKNIENDFNVDYVFNSSTSTSNTNTTNATNATNTNASTNNTNANSSNSSTTNNSQPTMQDKTVYIYIFETLLLFYFIIKCIISSDSPILIASLSFLLRILRLNWPIELSKVYLSKIIPQDIFSYLLYSLIIHFSSNYKVFILLIPCIITSLLYMSGFQRRYPTYIPQFLSKYIIKLRDYQDRLVKTRNITEILILPISILGIFLGFNSFFLPLIYYQFIKMRVSVDPKLLAGINEIKNYLLSLQRPGNSFINTVITKLSNACDLLKQ